MDRLRDRETDTMQLDKQTVVQIYYIYGEKREINRQIQIDRQIDRQMDGWMDGWIDRQENRQIDN